jgi:outer membrane receptor protein involved in Fe transport
MERSLIDATVSPADRPPVGIATQRVLRRVPRVVAGLLAATCVVLAVPTVRAAAPAAASGSTEDNGLAEIVVTAEKVRSTVQDTPISLTAVSAAQITAAGITTVEEIARDVPGLSMRSAGPGLTEYEARGLASNGGAAPTVGFYLDEIPLSPPALSQSGKVVIDPNLYDLDRVEVLRGPQGTLYGSGSMGGTVKVVTAQPKLDLFEGSVQGTLSNTQGGGGNWSGNAMLNLPFGDRLALRLVGSDTYRSGWIDQVNLGTAGFPLTLGSTSFGPLNAVTPVSVIKDANTERVWGGRATLLFKVSDDLSITAMVFKQSMALGGYDLLDSQPTSPQPGPVYDAHYSAFPFREGVHDDVQIYGLTINANLGFADLTSATSYFDRLGWQTQDASESIYWTNNGGSPFVAIPYSERDPSRQFSQELRLSSHEGGPLRWVAGAFYSELHSAWEEISNNAAMVPGYLPPPAPQPSAQTVFATGSFFTSYNPYTVSQIALFADGSYNIAEHWKLAAGLRWYKYNSRQDEVSWGFDGPNANETAAFANLTTTRAADRGYNPRLNLSYEPTRDLNLYATASKGFRPGGANQILPPPSAPPYCALPGPLSFGPDSAWNYEIGEKARMFDNWLTVNGDVYYIKWSGVQQVFTLLCGYQFYNNAGDGRSYGPELEVNAKLAEDWTLSLSGAYTDAKITSPSAAYLTYLTTQAVVAPGPSTNTYCQTAAGCTAPILNVAKDTASVTLMYSTTVAGDYKLSARVSDSFTGTATDVAYYYGYQLPSYSISNARLSLAHADWQVQLFVDNLTNKQALISANNTSFQFNIPQLVRYSTNQPRTFGTQINYHF